MATACGDGVASRWGDRNVIYLGSECDRNVVYLAFLEICDGHHLSVLELFALQTMEGIELTENTTPFITTLASTL